MDFLKVEGFQKKFGKTVVLKDINFSLQKGQVLSIIGSSGSGKTTLLRCLNFLETPDKGKLYLEDKLIYNADSAAKYSEKEIRNLRLNFGLVFQQFNLFPQYTVLKNVTLALELLRKQEMKNGNKARIKEEINNVAMEIITRVGLAQKANNYPSQLSGGQQQRVAIARALALKPKILFFDEPTSALDPELTGEILSVIKGLANKDTTMIIVTHEMNFAAEISDKVIFMDNGIIAESGTPDEVIRNPKNERVKQFVSKFND